LAAAGNQVMESHHLLTIQQYLLTFKGGAKGTLYVLRDVDSR
jgi:hypothetical protein